MNLVDVGIVVVILLGVFLGWTRGLIAPLLAEAGFLITLWIVTTNPAILNAIVPPNIPRLYALIALPGVIGVVVGIVGRGFLKATFRFPLARQADKVLGAVVHGGLAAVIVYVVVLGMAGADNVLAPITRVASLNGAGTIGPAQLAATQTLLSQYPEAGSFIDSSQLSQLGSAAAVHPLPFTSLGQYAQALAWYEQELRPQLKGSRLAPVVLSLGAHLPVVGRPITLPKS